jgi:hypothetical protein
LGSVKSQLAFRSWPQVLADPRFIAQSAPTLTDLLSIPLVSGGRANEVAWLFKEAGE